jgi:hypothetical protein
MTLSTALRGKTSMPKYTVGLWGCTRKGYDAEIAASASDTEKQIRVLRLARYDDVMIGCNYMTITGTCQSIQISRQIEVKTYLDDVIDSQAVSRGKPPQTAT